METKNSVTPVKNYEKHNVFVIKIVISIVALVIAITGLIVLSTVESQIQPVIFWFVIGFIGFVILATILFLIFAGRKKNTRPLPYFLAPLAGWTSGNFRTFELKRNGSVQDIYVAITLTYAQCYFESEEMVREYCRRYSALIRYKSTYFFVKGSEQDSVKVLLVQLKTDAKEIEVHTYPLTDKLLKASPQRQFVVHL